VLVGTRTPNLLIRSYRQGVCHCSLRYVSARHRLLRTWADIRVPAIRSGIQAVRRCDEVADIGPSAALAAGCSTGRMSDHEQQPVVYCAPARRSPGLMVVDRNLWVRRDFRPYPVVPDHV